MRHILALIACLLLAQTSAPYPGWPEAPPQWVPGQWADAAEHLPFNSPPIAAEDPTLIPPGFVEVPWTSPPSVGAPFVTSGMVMVQVPPPVRVYHFQACGGYTLPGGCEAHLEQNGWTQEIESVRLALRSLPTLHGVVFDNPHGKWEFTAADFPEARPGVLETSAIQFLKCKERAKTDPRYGAIADPFAFRNVMKKIRTLPREPEFAQARDLDIIVYIGWPPSTMTPTQYEEALSAYAGLTVVLDGESHVDPGWTYEEAAARQGRYTLMRSCLSAHGCRVIASEAFPSEGSTLCAQPSYATVAAIRLHPDVPYLTNKLWALWRGNEDGPFSEAVTWVQGDVEHRSLVMSCFSIPATDRVLIDGSHE